MKSLRILGAALLPLALSACALSPPAKVALPAPAQWHAFTPHNGSLTDLTQWWSQQGDPLLVQLIASAQAASPGVAEAGARIAASRAQRAASRTATAVLTHSRQSAYTLLGPGWATLPGCCQASCRLRE